MNGEQAKLERALTRQSLVHHRKREEELERILAGLLAHIDPKCRCRACRHLAELRDDLAG